MRVDRAWASSLMLNATMALSNFSHDWTDNTHSKLLAYLFKINMSSIVI